MSLKSEPKTKQNSAKQMLYRQKNLIENSCFSLFSPELEHCGRRVPAEYATNTKFVFSNLLS